jgi:hypothetical protein
MGLPQRLIYACSMPKLGPTATKTVQPKFPNLLDSRRFRQLLLVRVGKKIALITRRSGSRKLSRKFLGSVPKLPVRRQIGA